MGKRNNKRRIFRLIAAFCLLVGLLSISISQALYAKMKAEYDVAICDESMIVKSFDVISIVCIFGAAVLFVIASFLRKRRESQKEEAG